MPRRRKNAEFTRKQLPQTIDDLFAEFGVSDDASQAQANRRLVDDFYKTMNAKFPADAIVYIPPPESIHPKLSVAQQGFVFADYAVRQIAPIALDATGVKYQAAKLRKLPKIVDKDTAKAAYAAAYAAARDARSFADYDAALSASHVAHYAYARNGATNRAAAREAALTVREAARLNFAATCDTVTEMLYAL